MNFYLYGYVGPLSATNPSCSFAVCHPSNGSGPKHAQITWCSFLFLCGYDCQYSCRSRELRKLVQQSHDCGLCEWTGCVCVWSCEYWLSECIAVEVEVVDLCVSANTSVRHNLMPDGIFYLLDHALWTVNNLEWPAIWRLSRLFDRWPSIKVVYAGFTLSFFCVN